MLLHVQTYKQNNDQMCFARSDQVFQNNVFFDRDASAFMVKNALPIVADTRDLTIFY